LLVQLPPSPPAAPELPLDPELLPDPELPLDPELLPDPELPLDPELLPDPEPPLDPEEPELPLAPALSPPLAASPESELLLEQPATESTVHTATSGATARRIGFIAGSSVGKGATATPRRSRHTGQARGLGTGSSWSSSTSPSVSGGAITDGSTGTDASTGADTGTLADASPDAGTLQTLCVALIGAACGGGGPQTVDECVSDLGQLASCPQLQACIACAGAAPVATCADSGGGPKVAGCTCDIDACFDGGGRGDGSPGCSGTNNAPEGSGATSPGNPMVIASGGLATPIIFWGPAQAGGYGEPNGYEELSGLAPGESVAARIVTLGSSHCGTTGCPTDIQFVVGPFDAGTPTVIASTGSACGQALLTADGAGNLFFSVGKTGDGGAENNVGLLFQPSAGDAGADAAGGPHDAATDAD
jgi:hypothetical protein